MLAQSRFLQADGEKPVIKCVVWDLDDTLWRGTLLEGDRVFVTPQATEMVRALDNRGVLQSIASKNDFAAAWDALRSFGLDEYFLHPQIGWGSKSDSIRAIAEKLGIGLAAFAFIDDQPFERDEVRFSLPEVTTVDATEIGALLDIPAMPRVVSRESRSRRGMYQADIRRSAAEESFAGSKEEFLATLGMRMTIRPARVQDLQRAEELTIRTNQLNTSGRTYPRAELENLLHSDDHLLLVAELEDRYGSSGTIGLALVELQADVRLVKLLIMSCRVITRGVGAIMLSHILQDAKRAGSKLRAEFVVSGRNRMMYTTYKFTGFREVSEAEGVILLEHDLENIRPFPRHVSVRIGDGITPASPPSETGQYFAAAQGDPGATPSPA